MPNRIIKESIRTSKSVNAMTDFQFRLWVYLITYVDDFGRGSADSELLKGFVFPRRKRVSESDIDKALADLAGMGCIRLYNVDGESYFYFPNWGTHQRIQTKQSKFPEPPEIDGEIADDTEIHGGSRWVTVGHGESPLESNTNTNTNPNPNTKITRARYGEYQNVLLSDEEYAKLQEEFPDFNQKIESLSAYMASTGKSYKNHLATIRNWARMENEKHPKGESSFDTSEFFEAATAAAQRKFEERS